MVPPTTCYNRFVRWRKVGVWDRIFEAVSKGLRDGNLQMIDSSSIRVHQHAANASKGGSAETEEGHDAPARYMERSRGGLTT